MGNVSGVSTKQTAGGMTPIPAPGSKAATNRRQDAVRLAQTGLSQKLVALELGISQAAVSKLLATAVRAGEFHGQGPQVLGEDGKVRGIRPSTCDPELKVADVDEIGSAVRTVRKVRRRH